MYMNSKNEIWVDSQGKESKERKKQFWRVFWAWNEESAEDELRGSPTIGLLSTHPNLKLSNWEPARGWKTLSTLSSVNVSGTIVPLTTQIKLLGVTLDQSLSFDSHITALSKSCFYHIRALRHSRPILSEDTANLIMTKSTAQHIHIRAALGSILLSSYQNKRNNNWFYESNMIAKD